MSTPQAVSIDPAAPPRLSEPARIINTIIAPTKTFNDIRQNPSWWVPFLLIAVVSYGVVFLMDKRIGMEQIVQNAISQSPKAEAQFDKMAPEQRDQAMQMQVKIGRIMSYASPVITLIMALIIAGILLATFNFGFGAQIKFMNSMAIVMYSFLVTIISSAFMVLMMFLVEPDAFNVKNPMMSNPAYLMDPAKHPFFYGVASAFDIFTLWVILLMAIGYSLHSKVKRGTAFFTIFGWYFLFKLGSAALGAAFS